MKKSNLKLLAAFFSIAMMLFLGSCKDDPAPAPEVINDTLPVLDANFSFTVDDETNVVSFATDLIGTVWVTNHETGAQTTDDDSDGNLDVFIPLKGMYDFTFSAIVNGVERTSDTFDVEIIETNEEFLNSGMWYYITGGTLATKTWTLDVTDFNSTTTNDKGEDIQSTSYGSLYFHAALDFWGNDEAGAAGVDDDWGPWGGTNIYGWGGTPEDGNIVFDAMTQKATLTVDGVTTTDNFVIEQYERDDVILNTGDGAKPLSELMVGDGAKYAYLDSMSAMMADVHFSGNLRFPIDTGRLNNDGNATYPSQFLEEDIKNVTVLTANDSSLVMQIKRTYEGDAESKCWLLYNYVLEEYGDYGMAKDVVYKHAVDASITTSDLEGTWMPAPELYDWIGWTIEDRFSEWTNKDDLVATGWAGTAESYDSDTTLRITFTASTMTITKADTIEFMEVPYTLTNGYIALTDSIDIPMGTAGIRIDGDASGTYFYVTKCATKSDAGDVWIGQNNGDKQESEAIALRKVQ